MIIGLDAWLFWLILIVVFSVIEIATVNLVTIWFAGGSLAALICALAGASVTLQVIVAVAVSGVLLAVVLIFRPFDKLKKHTAVPTNYDRVIGMEAVVTEDIDGVLGKGQVVVAGQTWSALPEITDDRIYKDEVVYIKKVAGVKLIVSKNKGEL